MAAVRALRPNFDFLRRVCPSADTIVPVMTSKVHTSIKASNRFMPLTSLNLAWYTLLTLVFNLAFGKPYSQPIKAGIV
jgi:hypothetical protein